MKKANLGQIVWWGGRLHEVLSLGDGRSVTLKPLQRDPCPTCGSDHRVDLLEHSPLFQEGVAPVLTINGPALARHDFPTQPEHIQGETE